jgi:hypothetical protein
MVAGHRQDIANRSFLQGGAQLGVAALDLFTSHPGRGDTCVQRAGDHLPRKGWLGGELDVVGNPKAEPSRQQQLTADPRTIGPMVETL